jgi:hypothetical protein
MSPDSGEGATRGFAAMVGAGVSGPSLACSLPAAAAARSLSCRRRCPTAAAPLSAGQSPRLWLSALHVPPPSPPPFPSNHSRLAPPAHWALPSSAPAAPPSSEPGGGGGLQEGLCGMWGRVWEGLIQTGGVSLHPGGGVWGGGGGGRPPPPARGPPPPRPQGF